MINKTKIKLNDTAYYTCSYSGVITVNVLKVFDNDTALVRIQSTKKEHTPFVRPIEFLFCDADSARKSGKEWEHFERNRRKNEKKQKKQDSQKTKEDGGSN